MKRTVLIILLSLMLLSLVHAVEPRNAEASINVAWNLYSVEITATESAKFRDAEGNDIQS